MNAAANMLALDVGEAAVINVVGESHSHAFIGAYVRESHTGRTLATTQVGFVPALGTDWFLDGYGRIGSAIVSALHGLRTLEVVGAGQQLSGMAPPEIMETIPGKAWRLTELSRRPLLFVAGENNARAIYGAVPRGADIPVPFPPEWLHRVPRFEPTATVDLASILNGIRVAIEPLFQALAHLRRIGFPALAVHSVSPCSADDHMVHKALGFDSQALTRIKVIMLFNTMLRQRCEAGGILFVDRWNDFTDGGLPRPGFLLDPLHVGGNAMRQSLAQVYRAFPALAS